MTDNFHPNSDIDKLYISRTKEGRGLKEIKTMHENRFIAIRQHLLINNNRNNIMRYVIECEQSCIIRVRNELLTNKKSPRILMKNHSHLAKYIQLKKRKSMKRTILTKKCTGISKTNYFKMKILT